MHNYNYIIATTILAFLVTIVSAANTTVYPCGECMLIEVSYNPTDGSACSDTMFRYVFNNTEQCKDISNVVFGFGSNDIEFQTVDSTCITEIAPDYSPGCNETLFEHPWKFDFADGCNELSITFSDTIVAMGIIQYKAGTECHHCDVPVPKRCRDICVSPASAHSSGNRLRSNWLW